MLGGESEGQLRSAVTTGPMRACPFALLSCLFVPTATKATWDRLATAKATMRQSPAALSKAHATKRVPWKGRRALFHVTTPSPVPGTPSDIRR